MINLGAIKGFKNGSDEKTFGDQTFKKFELSSMKIQILVSSASVFSYSEIIILIILTISIFFSRKIHIYSAKNMAADGPPIHTINVIDSINSMI